jgi:hypothetical protein
LQKEHNDNIITCSKNKIKTTWNIVKSTLNIKPNVQLEYLDLTVLRRGVKVSVVVGRVPA